jgi:DNA-binding response OmpR family regulator
VADILVVEDNRTMAMTLEMSLAAQGHGVRVAGSVKAAEHAIGEANPDLVILDLGLPDGEGLDLCRQMREAKRLTPILILTARHALEDRVEGLSTGADDYITKPFELPELLARVDALLRRQRWHGSGGTVTAGRLTVDFDSHEASRDGEPVSLTDLELRLLRYLVEREGKVVRRDAILADVWGLPPSTRTRTVDVFVSRLRRLVESDPTHPRHIINVRGAGYRFVRDTKDDA